MNQKETENYMQEVGKLLEEIFPSMGFCLLIFNFYEPGRTNFISNANREEMIQALFESAYRLKNQEDGPTEPIKIKRK